MFYFLLIENGPLKKKKNSRSRKKKAQVSETSGTISEENSPQEVVPATVEDDYFSGEELEVIEDGMEGDWEGNIEYIKIIYIYIH